MGGTCSKRPKVASARWGQKPSTNTDVDEVTSRDISEAQVVEFTARRSVSTWLGERRRDGFPSVRLQPLGHLSVFSGKHSSPQKCVRPLNVPRSLTAIWDGSAFTGRAGSGD